MPTTIRETQRRNSSKHKGRSRKKRQYFHFLLRCSESPDREVSFKIIKLIKPNMDFNNRGGRQPLRNNKSPDHPMTGQPPKAQVKK